MEHKLKATIALLTLLSSVAHAGDWARPSKYTIDVTLPDCSDATPTTPTNGKLLITEAEGGWEQINDPLIHTFCVEPYDYLNNSAPAVVTLTADGSQADPRTILLYNASDPFHKIHPGKLSWAEQMNIKIVMDDADWWVLDRISHNGTKDPIAYPEPITISNGSTDNILNRFHLEHFGKGGIRVQHLSHRNTIQNSRIGNHDYITGLVTDRVCVELIDIDESLVLIYDTKVLNNEIFNCNDSFQAVRFPGDQPADYQGTIVDSNFMWVDSSVWTDCACRFEDDPLHDTAKLGQCSVAENAIDIKAGSSSPTNPFLVTNNVMWGFRHLDETATNPILGGTCSESTDHGQAMVLHNFVDNTIVEGNYILSSALGFVAGTPQVSLSPFALTNSTFSRNFIGDIGFNEVELLINEGYGIKLFATDEITAIHNVFYDTRKQWAYITSSGTDANNSSNTNFNCNIAVNSVKSFSDVKATQTADYHDLYNTEDGYLGAATGTQLYPDEADAIIRQLVLKYDVYTTSPQTKIVDIPTPQYRSECAAGGIGVPEAPTSPPTAPGA